MYKCCITFFLVFISSCIKEDPNLTGVYTIVNDSDVDVAMVNFALPSTGGNYNDTITIKSKQSAQEMFSSRSGFRSDPWNVYYADTVFVVFKDARRISFIKGVEIENNIRKQESWIVRDEGDNNTSFTYTITNEDYERAE